MGKSGLTSTPSREVNTSKKPADASSRGKHILTRREKEIVQLLAQGFHNREIGDKLLISEQTVRNHLHNIFERFGISNRLELALYAIHHHWLGEM